MTDNKSITEMLKVPLRREPVRDDDAFLRLSVANDGLDTRQPHFLRSHEVERVQPRRVAILSSARLSGWQSPGKG